MLDGRGVGDAVPDGFLVAEEVVKGVDVGLGLEEEAGHGGRIHEAWRWEREGCDFRLTVNRWKQGYLLRRPDGWVDFRAARCGAVYS